MGRPIGTVIGGSVKENPYIARLVDGGIVGQFPSAGAAQRAVDRSYGKVHLKWAREDLPGSIERHVGYDPKFWPLDFGDGLALWLDSNQGTSPTTVGGAERVTTWHSWDRNGNQSAVQATAANAPVLDREAAPGALDLVGFAVNAAEHMTTDLSLAPPYTLSVTASHEATAHAGQDILVSVGTERLVVSGGLWMWSTASGNIVGPAVVAGQLTVLTVVHSGAAGQLFVNGVSAGVQADVIAASAVSLSDAASYWGGALGTVALLNRVTGQRERGLLETWQLSRYHITP